MIVIPSVLKRTLGRCNAAINRQCNFANAIFLFGHMRSGSTALSNILCNHSEISGYGESHVTYRDKASLGELVINQWRRGAWKSNAPFLFDKILHTRYDNTASNDFYSAKAIFLIRRPEDSLKSIENLFERTKSDRFASSEQICDYYCRRIEALNKLWQRFPEKRKLGITYNLLIDDPELGLRRISKFLALRLDNYYSNEVSSRLEGAGDPLISSSFNRIVKNNSASTIRDRPPVGIDPQRLDGLIRKFDQLRNAFET